MLDVVVYREPGTSSQAKQPAAAAQALQLQALGVCSVPNNSKCTEYSKLYASKRPKVEAKSAETPVSNAQLPLHDEGWTSASPGEARPYSVFRGDWGTGRAIAVQMVVHNSSQLPARPHGRRYRTGGSKLAPLLMAFKRAVDTFDACWGVPGTRGEGWREDEVGCDRVRDWRRGQTMIFRWLYGVL
jgi:hypothetical protein